MWMTNGRTPVLFKINLLQNVTAGFWILMRILNYIRHIAIGEQEWVADLLVVVGAGYRENLHSSECTEVEGIN